MFYVIESSYVGPNEQDHLNDHSFRIQTVPGLTNMSHEPRTYGWLGTTNDWAEYALGEFETLEEAKSEVERLCYGKGYRELDLTAEDRSIGYDEEGELIGEIVWKVLESSLEYWSASGSQDWCYESMRDEITANTTDDELEEWIESCARSVEMDCQGALDQEAVRNMVTTYRAFVGSRYYPAASIKKQK